MRGVKVSEEKQRKEQGGSWVSFSTAVLLMGSASCFKGQQDFVCGLWAGRHWGIVKAQDFIMLQGEDKLGSCSGDSAGRGGDTHKVPGDQAAWTESRPSAWLCVPPAPSCLEAGHTVCHRGM